MVNAMLYRGGTIERLPAGVPTGTAACMSIGKGMAERLFMASVSLQSDVVDGKALMQRTRIRRTPGMRRGTHIREYLYAICPVRNLRWA